MTTYTIAVNERTSFYEVHKAGCAHVRLGERQMPGRQLIPCIDVEAVSAKDAAADYEARNEGCLTKLSPCARKGA